MTFDEYVASLGYRQMEDGRYMAPDGESFMDADQLQQVYGTAYQAATASPTQPLYGSTGQRTDGITVDGTPYQQIGPWANNSADPATALQMEISNLQSAGVTPTYDPTYGWIAPDVSVDPRVAAAHPEQNSDSIFDYGPFILGGGLAALAAGAGGIGLAGALDSGGAAAGGGALSDAAIADIVAAEGGYSALPSAGMAGTEVGGGSLAAEQAAQEAAQRQAVYEAEQAQQAQEIAYAQQQAQQEAARVAAQQQAQEAAQAQAFATPAQLPPIDSAYVAQGIGPETQITSGFTGGAGLSLADLARIPTPPVNTESSGALIPQGVKDAAGVVGGAGTLAALANQPAPMPAIDDAYVNQAIGPNTVLSGTPSSSALDTLGLQQMAAAAGLTGQAAQVFTDNGGMASTAPLADVPGYSPPGTVPISDFGPSPSGGTYGPNTSTGNITPTSQASPAAAKTALGKLLSGMPLSEDELGKLLGTLGSTALGVAGGMDQANAIREANDKNAAAFAAAQERAMATLTDAQKQALQSSGAGKDEAIKAYKASLAEAVRYNEQALKTGVSGFESGRDASIKASTDALASGLGYNEKALGKSLSGLQETRDQSLAMSNDARSSAMGILQGAQTGALEANRGTEDRYFGIGAPARARLEASYQPGFSMGNEPGYKDAIDQVMNSYLRKASVGGNPFENPGVSMEANKYVTAGTALPQLNTYRSQNLAGGNVGLDTAGSAGLQRPGIYSSLGQLQSNLASDFGRFDANINSTAGTNMASTTSRAGEFGTNLISDTGRSVAGFTNQAGRDIGNANIETGRFNTNLIDRSGANVANANLTTGQNDANLIGNLGRAGAGVLGQTYNSVPASNSGAYNAAGSGLANLTNPQQDYSAVMAQILKQFQLANGRAY